MPFRTLCNLTKDPKHIPFAFVHSQQLLTDCLLRMDSYTDSRISYNEETLPRNVVIHNALSSY